MPSFVRRIQNPEASLPPAPWESKCLGHEVNANKTTLLLVTTVTRKREFEDGFTTNNCSNGAGYSVWFPSVSFGRTNLIIQENYQTSCYHWRSALCSPFWAKVTRIMASRSATWMPRVHTWQRRVGATLKYGPPSFKTKQELGRMDMPCWSHNQVAILFSVTTARKATSAAEPALTASCRILPWSARHPPTCRHESLQMTRTTTKWLGTRSQNPRLMLTMDLCLLRGKQTDGNRHVQPMVWICPPAVLVHSVRQ